MAKRRVKMRLIRQILDYRLGKGVSADQTARALKLSKGAVINTMKRFSASDLSWPLPQELTDSVLESRLYPPQNHRKVADSALPSASYVEQELAKRGFLLNLGNGVYQITDRGEAYLAGEFDAQSMREVSDEEENGQEGAEDAEDSDDSDSDD